jgi:hypothetical protein
MTALVVITQRNLIIVRKKPAEGKMNNLLQLCGLLRVPTAAAVLTRMVVLWQTIGALGCLKSGIGLMGSSEMSVVANA